MPSIESLELLVCGIAKAYGTIVKPFTVREFGGPYMLVRLHNIYAYLPGESETMFVNEGEEIEVNIAGNVDGSWNSSIFGEEDIVDLTVVCKDVDCEECSFWESNDSDMVYPPV